MSDSSATLESYSYLGLATVVKRAHPQSGVDLTYIKQTGEANGDAGDQYTGLDRFGRVVDQRWIPTASPTNPTDRLQYTYDRDNNRLTRSNLVNTSFNEQYGYDGLNQLTSFSRGTHSQSWSLDAVGNWSSFTSDSNTQTRTANVQNQITSISGATTPAYDNNGNTTTDETGKTYVYDAWNRLVKATSGSNNVAYTVDSLSRRITTSANGGSATDLYYSSQWQVLEEDVSGSMTAQYVWSPVYVDALVERDTTSQRLYVQQDANWNVTSVVDTTGTVQERYAYDPYGKPTDGNGNAAVLTPAWASRATSLFSWIYLDQGGRFDATSGLYSFRNRDLSPTLGRWMEQDPIGYAAGDDNLYQEEGNSPTNGTDPLGLAGLKYYLWDAPLTFAGNVIVGAVNVPVEGAKLVYDVAGVATQILSMGSHQAFGTEVYQFELQSSLLRGMEAAPNPEAQGRFVVHAMANTMTLNGLAVVESRDSKELAQNLGAFGVNLGLAGVALGKGGKGAPTRPAAPSVQPGTWQPPPPSFTIRNPSFPPSAGNTPIFPMGPDFLPPGAGGGPIPPPPGWNPPPWNPNLPFKAH